MRFPFDVLVTGLFINYVSVYPLRHGSKLPENKKNQLLSNVICMKEEKTNHGVEDSLSALVSTRSTKPKRESCLRVFFANPLRVGNSK